jgi:AcrR family transcriptional regulator
MSRAYEQVAREHSRRETHEALLEAAEEELYEGRWQRTSLEEMARRAGVTKQTLLRHFGSKDGLLLQSLMRGAARILEQRWDTSPGDIAGAVENVLDHYEDWGERSLRIGAWQRESPVLATISQAAREVHYKWVEHAFAPWLADLDGATRARRRAALIVLCDVQTWWILSRDLGLPREEIQRILADLIERLVEGR